MSKHKVRRNGKPYLKGKTSPIDNASYTATIFDAVRAINADPDLDEVQKMKAIKHITSLTGKSQTDFLNKVYQKGYGSDVNTQTPLAQFIANIVDRRKSDKQR